MGEQMVSGAVGEIAAWTISAAIDRVKKISSSSIDEQLEHLDWLLTMIGSAVWKADHVRIPESPLRQWHCKLKELLWEGQAVLDSFRNRQAEAAASFRTSSALKEGAKLVIKSAKNLLLGDKDADKLRSTVRRLELANETISEFIDLLKMEIERSLMARKRAQLQCTVVIQLGVLRNVADRAENMLRPMELFCHEAIGDASSVVSQDGDVLRRMAELKLSTGDCKREHQSQDDDLSDHEDDETEKQDDKLYGDYALRDHSSITSQYISQSVELERSKTQGYAVLHTSTEDDLLQMIPHVEFIAQTMWIVSPVRVAALERLHELVTQIRRAVDKSDHIESNNTRLVRWRDRLQEVANRGENMLRDMASCYPKTLGDASAEVLPLPDGDELRRTTERVETEAAQVEDFLKLVSMQICGNQ